MSILLISPTIYHQLKSTTIRPELLRVGRALVRDLNRTVPKGTLVMSLQADNQPHPKFREIVTAIGAQETDYVSHQSVSAGGSAAVILLYRIDLQPDVEFVRAHFEELKSKGITTLKQGTLTEIRTAMRLGFKYR